MTICIHVAAQHGAVRWISPFYTSIAKTYLVTVLTMLHLRKELRLKSVVVAVNRISMLMPCCFVDTIAIVETGVVTCGSVD